jgi:hypothetical protein
LPDQLNDIDRRQNPRLEITGTGTRLRRSVHAVDLTNPWLGSHVTRETTETTQSADSRGYKTAHPS